MSSVDAPDCSGAHARLQRGFLAVVAGFSEAVVRRREVATREDAKSAKTRGAAELRSRGVAESRSRGVAESRSRGVAEGRVRIVLRRDCQVACHSSEFDRRPDNCAKDYARARPAAVDASWLPAPGSRLPGPRPPAPGPRPPAPGPRLPALATSRRAATAIVPRASSTFRRGRHFSFARRRRRCSQRARVRATPIVRPSCDRAHVPRDVTP